jgi:cytochrome c peroxidase
MTRALLVPPVLVPSVLALAACDGSTATTLADAGANDAGAREVVRPLVREAPLGFPQIPTPGDNPLTEAKAQLGKQLFFEKRLSRTSEISCGSCHLQDKGFSDPNPYSTGVEGRVGDRNAPALINLAYTSSFFWDGGVISLEDQSIAPVQNPLEMDLALEDAVARLEGDAHYEQLFDEAFGTGPTPGNYTRAVASFVRTLVSGNSRYDRYLAGEPDALSDAEKRGETLFMGEEGECFHCHVGFNLTNDRFAHNGTFVEGDDDVGRERVTLNQADRGRFKVPTLRNVAVSAPYMHDGSLATLDDVLAHYAAHGRGDRRTDATLLSIELSPAQQRDVVAFLGSLTDDDFLGYPGYRENTSE